jgi:hypothetical protein
MSLLLEAIEERQLLGIDLKDKNNLADYLDYALDTTKQTQVLVVPASWLNNAKHRSQLQTLFEKYVLIGLIDLGTIWSPVTALPFSLLVLFKTNNKKC